MGISYSLVKTEKPEAWEIGKDYLDFKSLFPPCASPMYDPNSPVSWIAEAAKTSQYFIVGNNVFVISDLYPTVESFIEAVLARLNRKDDSYVASLRQMYHWAKNDPLQFIAEFDDLDFRDAADEYQLCDIPRKYIHVDSWNGTAGRAVGEDFDEDEEEA
jgi:hypothetical protein